MAATGKTPILLYGSTTATNQPSAGNLTNSSDGCEIAINVADKNLFFKDATNTVNTVPIRQSSASSDGWLSSTDWSTFNSKQPAGTYVTSVTGTAPVVSSGGTTPAISMAAATGSVNGYLTSTDWTTFNGKQAALVSGTNIKTVSGTTLLGSGDLGTIGTGYGGTGLTSFTANGVVYASSTSALTTGSGLTYNGSTLATSGTFSYNGSIGEGSATTLSSVGVTLLLGQSSTWTNTRIYAGGVEQFRASNTGDCTVYNGNLVIGTSGKGIDFSATSGTGTSELLADYEEGTWTPSYAPETGSFTSLTMIVNHAHYTKIGRQVFVEAYIATNGINTAGGSGSLLITGLPYASGTSNISGSVGIGFNWTNYPASVLTADVGGTRLYMGKQGLSSAMQVSDMVNSSGLQNFVALSISYYV